MPPGHGTARDVANEGTAIRSTHPAASETRAPVLGQRACCESTALRVLCCCCLAAQARSRPPLVFAPVRARRVNAWAHVSRRAAHARARRRRPWLRRTSARPPTAGACAHREPDEGRRRVRLSSGRRRCRESGSFPTPRHAPGGELCHLAWHRGPYRSSHARVARSDPRSVQAATQFGKLETFPAQIEPGFVST